MATSQLKKQTSEAVLSSLMCSKYKIPKELVPKNISVGKSSLKCNIISAKKYRKIP